MTVKMLLLGKKGAKNTINSYGDAIYDIKKTTRRIEWKILWGVCVFPLHIVCCCSEEFRNYETLLIKFATKEKLLIIFYASSYLQSNAWLIIVKARKLNY